MRFECEECGAQVDAPRVVRSVTCGHCGDVSFVTDGRVRRVYPSFGMYPIDTADGVVSKWMPTGTRPCRHGLYEVRLRAAPDVVVRAWWNLAWWSCGRDVLTWRGALA